MALTLLAPPAAAPLTLDQAKAWLRLDTTDEDDLVAALLGAATRAVEAACGRLLMPQAWRWRPGAWTVQRAMTLPLAPVRAVTAARWLPLSGPPVALAAADIALEAGVDPPRITLLRPPPDPPGPGAAVEFDLAAGHADAQAVPEDLRQAVRLVLAGLFEHRGEQADAVLLPAAAAALLSPHRRRRLP